MRIAIMQPYFFPYIGYFQLINAVDKFIIYDDVNYINKGWINRNNILVNGQKSLLTIPLADSSQNKLIKDIFVSDDERWRLKMLKTLELSYKKAPFFSEVFKIFSEALEQTRGTISQLNYYSIKKVCAYLKIEINIIETSSTYGNQHLNGQDRILDICVKENASTYINPSGGIALYNKSFFEENDIQLHFINPKINSYEHNNNTFVPWLSIIDVLMFVSVDKIKSDFLSNYDLT